MFFVIHKVEQSSHHTDRLQNPKHANAAMVLGVYRTHSRTALFNLYSKKAFGEFWDEADGKKIARRHWSPEMKAFAAQKIDEAPRPPYIFKFTVIGWIFLLLVVGFFGFLIYDSNKAPLPKAAEYVAMEKAPIAGDIYFGHYETYKEKGNPIGTKIGFGWFKVIKVEGSNFSIAKSTDMSNAHKPKEQLGSTEFETQTTMVLITAQEGYLINMKSVDGLTEIYLTDKK